MNIWFNAIARAGGIEVAPGTGWRPTDAPKARRTRPTLARRLVADISGGVSLPALGSRVLRLGQALSVWRRRRAAIGELSALSDHALKDIGLHRGEIRSVVDAMARAAAPAQRPTPVSRRPARRRPALADTFLGARPCAQPC